MGLVKRFLGTECEFTPICKKEKGISPKTNATCYKHGGHYSIDKRPSCYREMKNRQKWEADR